MTGRSDKSTQLPEQPTDFVEKPEMLVAQVPWADFTLKTSSGYMLANIEAKISSAYNAIFHDIYQRIASTREPGRFWMEIQLLEDAIDKLNCVIETTKKSEPILPLPTLELETFEYLYQLRKRFEVLAFLSANPFLVRFLEEAYWQITKYFGSSVEAVLEVAHDSEATGQELAILIRTDLSPSEAFKKVRELDQNWWLNTSADIRQKICIDVEFK